MALGHRSYSVIVEATDLLSAVIVIRILFAIASPESEVKVNDNDNDNSL